MSVPDDGQNEELLASAMALEKELSQSIGSERELDIGPCEFQVVAVQVKLFLDCAPHPNLDRGPERDFRLLKNVFGDLDRDVQNLGLR